MVLAELGGKLRDSLRKLQTQDGRVDQAQLNALLNEVSRALIEADVNVKLVMTLRDNIKRKVMASMESSTEQATATSRLVQKAVADELTQLLTAPKKPPVIKRNKSNIILFVGLQGSGKTTSIAKVANYYSRRGYKTAMVCADTFRAGAFDQLKQNATKLRVPFYGSYTEADPVEIAQDGVDQFRKDGYEVILVDTSGRHLQESSLLEEMQEISAAIDPTNIVFVVDATQGQAVHDQALAFSNSVNVGSILITKLDGHAKGGGALSAVAATESPILFLGSGEHFDDLDPFYAQSFVSKLLGFGDVRGLMEEMKTINEGGKQSQEELMEKLSKGEFTLRDMYNQFQSIMKIGPLNKVMGMLPGVPDYLIPKSGDEEGTRRLKKFMYMMDSMTDAELDGKVNLHKDPTRASRIKRISRGSGVHPMEVQMLLQCHQQFESVVSKMGKSGLMGKVGPGGSMANQQKQLAAQMRKNPNQVMQRLNQMDPKLVQQMGGTENMMNMMQQMARGGGGMGGGGGGMGAPPPDMGSLEAMMSSMGGGGGGGIPPGMDMNSMAQMMQSMGMGGSGRR